MAMITEGRHAAEFVLWEEGGALSRDNITIAENQDIKAGQVLGQVTADNSYVAHNAGAADGSQNAAAIALYAAKTGDGETMKIAAITNNAEVNGKIIIWADGITDANRNAGIAALAEKIIKVR